MADEYTKSTDSFIERRKSVVERRLGLDRRRGPGKRIPEERKAAEEGEMNDEQFEFLMVIDQYKRLNRRPFPSWTEVLDFIRAMGYSKVEEPQPLQTFKNQEQTPAKVS